MLPYQERYRNARGQTVTWPIPTGPVLRIVDRWLEDGHSIEELNALTGAKDVGRTITRLRTDQQFMRLTTADMLVTATVGPQAWHTDPELKRAIEWLDQRTGPYCHGCWAATTECECAQVAA